MIWHTPFQLQLARAVPASTSVSCTAAFRVLCCAGSRAGGAQPLSSHASLGGPGWPNSSAHEPMVWVSGAFASATWVAGYSHGPATRPHAGVPVRAEWVCRTCTPAPPWRPTT